MRPAIRVEDLWKRYRIGAAEARSDTFYDVLSRALRAPLDRLRGRAAPRVRHEDFWALRGLEFEVAPGEVLGVIGRNGAGKSTLLKILSRITEPTRGRVEIIGRVSSLLEVGTGFHPELTGRENIFLNGAILGMGRREIARKFDEIVAFAEIEQFLDTPVKRYSSGMYVRLAFAVAAHMEPDVLLVDEVLAVGDVEFQRKCLAKMGEAQGEGRTVLFVSHNMSAIRHLCRSALLLDRGEARAMGPVSDVVQRYLGSGPEAAEVLWREPERAPGNERVRLRSVRVLSENQPATEVAIDRPIELEVGFWILQEGLRDFCINLYVKDLLGATVFSTANTKGANLVESDWFHEAHSPGLYRSRCVIPANFLNDLVYRVSVYAVSLTPMRIEAKSEDVVDIHVRETGAMREPGKGGEWHGLVRPRFEWRTERVGPLDRGASPFLGKEGLT